MSATAAVRKNRHFAPGTFLATIGYGARTVAVQKKQTIFAQGTVADAVFYIQVGKVSFTVVSKTGKEATLGILSEGEFFGEGGLAGQPLRMGSATALTDCELMRIHAQCHERFVENACVSARGFHAPRCVHLLRLVTATAPASAWISLERSQDPTRPCSRGNGRRTSTQRTELWKRLGRLRPFQAYSAGSESNSPSRLTSSEAEAIMTGPEDSSTVKVQAVHL